MQQPQASYVPTCKHPAHPTSVTCMYMQGKHSKWAAKAHTAQRCKYLDLMPGLKLLHWRHSASSEVLGFTLLTCHCVHALPAGCFKGSTMLSLARLGEAMQVCSGLKKQGNPPDMLKC